MLTNEEKARIRAEEKERLKERGADERTIFYVVVALIAIGILYYYFSGGDLSKLLG